MTEKEYLTIEHNQAGIYWFKNIVTNEYYIGQSINIRKRLYEHLRRMKCKYNYPIYNALNKYGLPNFEFHIEKVINREKYTKQELSTLLNKLEIKYIKLYNSYNCGYNLTIGGESISGYKISEALKEKYSKISSKIQNDGRNTLFVYNIKTKEYSQWSTLAEFNRIHNTKNKNLIRKKLSLVDHQWIGARSLEELKKKVSDFSNYHSTSEYKCDMSSKEFISDLKELSIKEILQKYNITKGTYYNYLHRLKIPNKSSINKDPRIKCHKEQFIKDYYILNRNELCQKYNISIRRYYDLCKKYIN